jgi:glucose uptake protein GlcU
MSIPNNAITPLYLVSFVLFAFQYFRINYERRLMNLQFGMMLGAIVLMFTTIFITAQSLSWVFFLLGMLWLGVAIFLFRKLLRART